MIIRQSRDISLEAEASNGQDLREKLQKAPFDVIILDITLPGGLEGIDLLAELREQYPKTAVLMMSMHPEEQFAVRALKAGASGYLVKGSIPSELLSAIRKVASGGKHVSASLAEQLVYALDGKREKAPHEYLSDREFRVLRSLASGRGLTETAEELCLSTSTVATYRARILSKLNLQSNAELIHYTIENRLL